MKKSLFGLAIALLLAAAGCCGHMSHRGPGGPGCPQHQGCECKCRSQADCPKPDCPQHQAPSKQ